MPPSYQYAGLARVKRPGLTVDQCAHRLHHLAYAEERLMQLQAAHLVTLANWDLKMLLGRFQYEDALHADSLKTRLPELRLSKNRAYGPPDSPLGQVFDEALQAAGEAELLAALVRVFKPALLAAYRRYLDQTNPLADYPSARLLKQIIPEEEEALALYEAAYQELVPPGEADDWASHLQSLLEAAGGIDGSGPLDEAALRPRRADPAYRLPRQIARDDTFPQIWDFPHVENQRVSERLAQMVSTRLSEITAAEGLAYVLCENQDQPWEFYVDIARHLWDEVRHTLFGEAASEDIFADRAAMPIRVFDQSYVVQLDPMQQYAALGLGIEAAMMKYPPGKREEFEFCRDTARYPLMANFQDFDWADEVLHVNIARRQLKQWFSGSQTELLQMAKDGVALREKVRAQQEPVPLPDVSHHLGQKPEADR